MIRKIYSGVLMITSLCASYGYYYGEYGYYDEFSHKRYWQDGFKVTLGSEEHYMKIHKNYTKNQLEYQIDNSEKQELTTRDRTELCSSLDVMKELVDLAWKLNEKGVTMYRNILNKLNTKNFSAAQLNSAILLVHMVDYFDNSRRITSTNKDFIKDFISRPDGFRTSQSLSKYFWKDIKEYYLPSSISLDNLKHDLNFYWNIFGGYHWCEVKFACEMRYNEENHMNITAKAIGELLNEEEEHRKEYYAKLDKSSNSDKSYSSETNADSSYKGYSEESEKPESYDDSSSDTEDNSYTEYYNSCEEQSKEVIISNLKNKIAEQNKIAKPQTTELANAVQKAMEWSRKDAKYHEDDIKRIWPLIAEGKPEGINTALFLLISAAQEDFLGGETISNYVVTDDGLTINELLYNLGDWLRMRSFIAIGIIRRIYIYCYDKTEEAIRKFHDKTSITTIASKTKDFFSICDILCAPEQILDYIANIFLSSETIGYAKTLIGLEEEDLKKIFIKLLNNIDIEQITNKDIDSILSSFTKQKVTDSESLESIVESNLQALSEDYINVAKKIIDNVYARLVKPHDDDLKATFSFLLRIANSIPEETNGKACKINFVTQQIINHISSEEKETRRLEQGFNIFIKRIDKIVKHISYEEKTAYIELVEKAIEMLSEEDGVKKVLILLKLLQKKHII